ncbi:MAG: hypothetical protein GX922_07395 [Firmicutes bacterium]|nr:hypothetical protein [Bacillota bacterium]
MKIVSTLPYICQDEATYCLFLKDDVLICEIKKPGTKDTEIVELLKDCQSFEVASGQDNKLHILAVSNNNKLNYFFLTGNQAQQMPFITEDAPNYFQLAASPEGQVYYCAQNGTKIIFATLTKEMNWQSHELAFGHQPAPLNLVVDQNHYAHLLVYDLTSLKLSYLPVELNTYHYQQPFTLATKVQLQTNPAFLFDSVQNIHIAWISAQEKLLHYQARLAGGWPVGGWQHPLTLPLDFTAKLMSFSEAYPQAKLWLLDDEQKIHYFKPHETAEKTQSFSAEKFHPVRLAQESKVKIALIPESENATLLDSAKVEIEAHSQIQTSIEEENSPLFLHARRLMAEKKRLEYELSKKEATLAQFRHMLELSQSNVRKQTITLNEKLSDINKKVKELQETNSTLATRCKELEQYHENFLQTKMKLEKTEEVINTQKVELEKLRQELTAALKQKKEQQQKISMLEEELLKKKGVWDTVTSLFQKKTSPKE